MPLMELATRQHGVVSTRQLAELGYTRSSASKANKVGRLHRVHRGVYAVGHRQLTWEGRCMAAVLARRDAIASHASAAWLWGLLRTRPATIHITVPVKGSRSSLFVVHRALLADRDVGARDRMPVTSVARTLLDFAAEAGRDRLEKAFERAEDSGRFHLPEVEDVLRRAGGHPGRGRLGEIVRTYRPDPELTRSGVERRFRQLVVEAGLPRPSMNFVEAGYELDAYWPQLRFCVELDVYETHGSRIAFERDRVRAEDLALEGIQMVRITGVRLQREPRAVVESLSVLLERRRRELTRPGS
jgi:hypothetical protein